MLFSISPAHEYDVQTNFFMSYAERISCMILLISRGFVF